MNELNVTPLPVVRTIAPVRPRLEFESLGYVDDAAIEKLVGEEESRPAMSPQRGSRLQGDAADYAGWFSPYHASREMAFARG